MLRITLVLFIVGGTVAQIKLPGACPNIETVKNFDVRRHMGKWYEIAVYTDQPTIHTQCMTAIYTLNNDGSFKIENTTILSGPSDTSSEVSTAGPTDNARNGKYTIKDRGVPYWVLATDYDAWLLLWSCEVWLYKSIRSGWIFTRARNPSNAVIEAAYAEVRARKLDKYFHQLDNSGCPKSY